MALAFLVLAFALAMVPVLTVFTGVHAAGAYRSTKPTFAHFKGLTYALAQSQNGSQPPPPPTDQQCRKQIGVPCYSPQEIRRAYNIDPVLNAGYTGKGESIVISTRLAARRFRKTSRFSMPALACPIRRPSRNMLL
jgi:hypothetical protein